MEWFMAFGLGTSIGGLIGAEIYRRIKRDSYAHLWKQLEEYYNVKAELDMAMIAIRMHCKENCEWVESVSQSGCVGHTDCPLFNIMEGK